MDAKAVLEQADACHDEDPARAAALLRQVDAAALDPDQRPRLAFLLNHVLGERLDDWAGAHARMQALMQGLPADSMLLCRHAAVAARGAGDAAAAQRHTEALAALAGAPGVQAVELVALASAALGLARLPAAAAGQRAAAALAALAAPHWQQPGPLDAAAAAQCNNIGSALVDRPVADLAEPALREAMQRAAQAARQLWRRAGTWVNAERAEYLLALVTSALGDPAQALAHARAGLALLDTHDAAGDERVDRAFLALEAAFALERLGDAGAAQAARRQADALAAAFGDAGLERWYAERVARNATLGG